MERRGRTRQPRRRARRRQPAKHQAARPRYRHRVNVAQTTRQAPLLRNADGLWDRLRPASDVALRRLYGRRGITISITAGAGERIRVDPGCRAFAHTGEDQLWTHLMAEIQPGDRLADI